MRPVWQIAIVAVIAIAGAGIWHISAGPRPADAQQARGAPRPVEVVATAAATGDIAINFDAVGTLRANEAVTVTSKLSGIIEQIRFQEGQQVKAGEVLVQLDANEARAELAVAEANRRNTAQELERSVSLLSRQAVAQARVDDLKIQLQAAEARVNAARARLQDLTIVSPFAGVAGLRRVSPGALVRPGEPVTTVDDVATLKLEFTVPESALRTLAPGQPIQGVSAVYPKERFAGRVSAIDTRVDPVSRTLSVVALMANSDLRLRPGMFLTVQLTMESRKNAVLIPEEALVPVADRQFVFAVIDGKAVRKQVVIGARQNGLVEVASGLKAGDVVVTRGVQKVRDGAPVKPTMEPPRTTTAAA